MFEARFIEATSFKKVVDALRDFKEINLECDEDGINLKVMDECHVSLADLRLSSSFFEFYRCDEKCTIGLNVEMLTKMIRSAPGERALVLRKSEDSDRLRIESDDDVETGIRRAADVSLLRITIETLDIPNTQYQAEIELPTKIYSTIIKDLTSAGENVTISVTSKAMKFETDGERGRLENIFHKGQGAFIGTQWNFDGNTGISVIEQSFALRFLVAFTKACPLSDSLILSMSTACPIRLQFPIGIDSYLSYYVAPTLD